MRAQRGRPHTQQAHSFRTHTSRAVSSTSFPPHGAPARGGSSLLYQHKNQPSTRPTHTSKHASNTQPPQNQTSPKTKKQKGTSVNPLLRCAHLAAETACKVLLVVPWLDPDDQKLVFPPGQVFASKEAHAEFILREARERTALACDFRVLFYDGALCRKGGRGAGS